MRGKRFPSYGAEKGDAHDEGARNEASGGGDDGELKTFNEEIAARLDGSSDPEGAGSPTSEYVSQFTIQPIPRKVSGGSPGSSQDVAGSAGCKRSAPIEEVLAESKKGKKKRALTSVTAYTDFSFSLDEENKRRPGSGPVRRLYSDEDEITILQGFINFKERSGTDPRDDWNEFYVFIKDSLSVEVSKAQLMDKVKSLKRKYFEKIQLEDEGEESYPIKDRYSEAFRLSKEIWKQDRNSLSGGTGKRRENRRREKNNDSKVEEISYRPLILALPKFDGRDLMSQAAASSGRNVCFETGKGIEKLNSDPGKADDNLLAKENDQALNGSGKDFVNGQLKGTELQPEANGETIRSCIDDAVVEEDNVYDVEEFWCTYPCIKEFLELVKVCELSGFDSQFYYENTRLMGSNKAKEINERWKKLKLERVELQAKRLELVAEQMKQVFDAVKKE